MGRLSHTEIEELLGAFALDALDSTEAAEIDAHLRACPRCRAEVAGHREVAALLAHQGADAPSGVWDRIAGEIGGDDAGRDLPPAPVLPFRRRSPQSGVPRRVVAAIVSAAAVIIGLLSFQVVRQDDRLRAIEAAVRPSGIDSAAQAALLHPSARKVLLRSEDGRLEVQTVVLPNGEGYVVRDNLPGLASDRAYQLWAITGATTVSVGVLGSQVDAAAFRAPVGVQVLAITEEQAGGVPITQHKPLVVGTVA